MSFQLQHNSKPPGPSFASHVVFKLLAFLNVNFAVWWSVITASFCSFCWNTWSASCRGTSGLWGWRWWSDRRQRSPASPAKSRCSRPSRASSNTTRLSTRRWVSTAVREHAVTMQICFHCCEVFASRHQHNSFCVLSDKLYSCMFRLIGGHLQAVKVSKSNIIIATSFLLYYLKSQQNAQLGLGIILIWNLKLKTPTCFCPCRIIIRECTQHIITYKTLRKISLFHRAF